MAYSLSTHYAGQGLLDSFSFFTGEDPSHGFVNYQGREAALASNLVSIDKSNRVKLGVDSINTYSTSDSGRPSVRITSNDDFTYGLFIADFAHMPSSTCGTWPAFWAFNNEGDWPTGGEVDIIEGANTAQRNLFSAHTRFLNENSTSGCQSPGTGFIGIQGPSDCSATPENVGCNYAAPTSDSTSYGDAFNAVGGGVYALEWGSQNIKIWHFPRTAIPDNVNRAPLITPDPTTWGPPQALFGGSGCKADSHFFNMSLVINTNFCGDYAGNIWGVTDQCNQLAPTCKEYVARNPSSFSNAFWEINYIDVYKKPLPTESTLPSSFLNTTTLSASATSPPDTVVPSKTRTITQTISTASPTQTGGGLADPATINGWTLLGCFGSLAGYKSFSQMASFATMDNEACVASCAGRKYAGVSGETCYCADVLGDATAVANDKCDVPCPGNAHEICGGVLSAGEAASSPFAALGISRTNATVPQRNMRLSGGSPSSPRVDPLLPRAAPSTVLLTVYGNVNRDAPSGAPGMGGTPQVATATASAVMMTSVVTVTFTTVCATDAAKLITLEYCATLTGPACGNCTATPAVPITTFTQSCDACGPGGENSVTLAVPQAIAAGTGAGPVVAIAVQTVVPILAHNASSGNASFHSPGASGGIPVVAAGTATVNRTAGGFMETLGYGLILWFVVFGIGIVL
ncbi:glycoside hydrolase family 16 protein [Xylaria digitata]|nr:glycoside hydrolase family 16 protein [Xylaria digitata]